MSELSLLALIGVLSISCQWLAWRLKTPAILPLLVCGLIIGPTLGWLNPDQLFDDLLFPLVSLAVAVILFEGSLTLKFEEIRGHGRMVTNLVSVGMVVTWIAIGVLTHFLMGWEWELSALFGALVVVTGPTVIQPMIRSIRPINKLANILRWEGIIIDPLGALLAVLVYEFIIASQDVAFLHSLQAFAKTIGIGFFFGWVAAKLLGLALGRGWFPHYLQNVATLTIVLGVFALSNAIQHESGLLTVTVMGMAMANTKNLNLDEILEFKETLSVLLISALFIILAARLDYAQFDALGLPAVILLAIILFAVRPLAVWLSAIGTELRFKDKVLLSWIAPRGIVAAAVSALFALKMEQSGWDGAESIVPLVFLVIMTTVVLQSLTAKPLARLLGLIEPPARGFLIFGANQMARAVAKSLQEHDVQVRLADTNWENIRSARMDNLPVYFGNPASEHASNNIDLTGIGRLLVMSPYKQLNPLVSVYYQDWFGSNKVHGLNSGESDFRASHQLSEAYKTTLNLFGESVTYSKLASLHFQGAKMKSTPITDNFSFEDYQQQYGARAVPMFALDEQKKVHIFSTERELKPMPGWLVIAMISPEKEAEEGGRDDE
ncbi:MAG: sodium:proton exchanger [Idiomarina sp.]|uniref:Sodium/proton antiporter (CPA1 family) n=1 Tax=Idiomarina aquatica TaxID=1327752 RepID=A0A4R6PKG1_9GAMM|nr:MULTISPECIES: sodium:proton antiporter [Idiomarina]MBT41838.1 sodium:proton exchanger [Idiomarina sp.]TDP38908.1 sodium/proton antiporter (CPA1 family) [Idiomarina aquatica]